MSTIVGNIVVEVRKTQPNLTAPVIASALAVVAGCIILFIGLVRAGWVVDLISLVSLSAFMTGSAITIAVGQIPTMLGITGFSTRDPSYLVFIHTLQNLGKMKLDAAMGLTALTLLYLIRSACSWGAHRYPTNQRLIFFISTLRTVFVILLYTMISWLVNKDHRTEPSFKILQDVPRGFQHAGVPMLNASLIRSFLGDLPATVIVLLIEHIAISKSFGRVNNYVINPSQEMVAIGVTNILGPFLGGYPSTGSFSRTAIKSKAGVRTPFAGVITAVVVLLAIYALPAAFYYIPSASLAAVIIHAVGDLITPPNTVYQFWRVSPLEVIIFFIGVIVTVFSTIENGIYCTIAISAAMLIVRILKARGRFLGKVKVHSVIGDNVIGDDHRHVVGNYGTFMRNESKAVVESAARNIFLPIDHGDGSNPDVELDNPYPGIFVYRFSEGFNYPNASHSLDYLTSYVFAHTRRTNPNQYIRPGDRPWNDPGPSRKQLKRAAAVAALGVHPEDDESDKPTLKAIILDFSSVNNVDITSVQHLIDVRNQLDRYASPDIVNWHIACIGNRWTKRALASAGFGYPTLARTSADPYDPPRRWQNVFSVAEIGGCDPAAAVAAELELAEKQSLSRHSTSPSPAPPKREDDEDDADDRTRIGAASASSREDISSLAAKGQPAATTKPGGRNGGQRRTAVVNGLNRPLFHVDLISALQSAIANVEAREAHPRRQVLPGVV